MISRRIFLVAGIPGLVAARARADVTDFLAAVAAIEKTNGGRLGVCEIDTATGHRLTHRGDERFAMCSTHKALTAGFVLQRVDRGEESLDRQVAYDKSALVAYSPATEKRAGEGMTIGELCRAAITLSDNTAANLLLATLGGPEGSPRGRGRWATRLPGSTESRPHSTRLRRAILATRRHPMPSPTTCASSRSAIHCR